MPHCPFSLRPTPERGDTDCPCVLFLGNLGLTLRKEEGGAPAVLRAELAYMPPMVGLLYQRWGPSLYSAQDWLWLKGEKIHMVRITTQNRSVPGDRRMMLQSSFICKPFNSLINSNPHLIVANLIAPRNPLYLWFTFLNVDVKGNLEHPIGMSVPPTITETYLKNHTIYSRWC